MGNTTAQTEAINTLKHRLSRLQLDHIDVKLKEQPALDLCHFTKTVKNTEYIFTDSELKKYNFKDESW